MINVALIGLGNIALLYDYEKSTNTSLSHSKGIYKHEEFTLKYCVDINCDNESKVKELFPDVVFSTDINDLDKKSDIDVLVISTPTHTHFDILEKMQKNENIKVFFIEKPLFSEPSDFSKVFKRVQDKLVINYIRNFEPNIIKLKKDIQNNKLTEPEKIVFTYTKGFKNNGSHFVSLFNFLFENSNYNSSKIIREIEALENDPTYDLLLEIEYKNKNIPIYFIGLNHEHYAVFNIELYFSNKKLVLNDVEKSIKTYEVVPDKDYPAYKVFSEEYNKLDLDYDNIMYHAYEYIKQKITMNSKKSHFELEKKNNELFTKILEEGKKYE